MVLIYTPEWKRVSNALDKCEPLGDAPHILRTDDPTAVVALRSKYHSGILIDTDPSEILDITKDITIEDVIGNKDNTVNFSIGNETLYNNPNNCIKLDSIITGTSKKLINSSGYMGAISGWFNTGAKLKKDNMHVDNRDSIRAVMTLRGNESTLVVANKLSNEDYKKSIPLYDEKDYLTGKYNLLNLEYLKSKYDVISPKIGQLFIMKCHITAAKEGLQSPVHGAPNLAASNDRLFMGMDLKLG